MQIGGKTKNLKLFLFGYLGVLFLVLITILILAFIPGKHITCVNTMFSKFYCLNSYRLSLVHIRVSRFNSVTNNHSCFLLPSWPHKIDYIGKINKCDFIRFRNEEYGVSPKAN